MPRTKKISQPKKTSQPKKRKADDKSADTNSDKSEELESSRQVSKSPSSPSVSRTSGKIGDKETDVTTFAFNKKRVRVLSSTEDVPENCDRSGGVLYWMSRDQRVQDNWALLYAQRLALKCETPLHVGFCLVPKFLDATIRHYRFMLKGLEEVSQECKSLNISFHLLLGQASSVLPKFVKDYCIQAVITDFSPLRTPMQWVEDVNGKLPSQVPFCQVDAHNIVPCWEASVKQEYAARTIRGKIQKQLPEFLTEFPAVIYHPFNPKAKAEPVDWNAAEESLEVNRSVGDVDWASPGTKAGFQILEEFCRLRLKGYSSGRNDPNKDHLSNLSPWLHFGQISAQRCALEVNKHKSSQALRESAEAFIEETVVRRELSDNFCFYNPKYDQVDGASDWAKKTLDDHKKDKRPYLYTRQQLEDSKTYDDLWNAAQMVHEGKMHGFLRMYWAKKILEWTESPEEALAIAIYLNDKYELDGRDPNGYVGCMWSICGIHDMGWAERPIFGKIRYMNYNGCKRKFDIQQFVSKYNKYKKK